MKIISSTYFCLPAFIICGASSFLSAQALDIKEALTADEVAAKRQAGGEELVEAGVEQLSGDIKIEERKPSLLADSCFLIGYHGYTLVPKGAVFSTGKAVQLASYAPVKGKLMNWEAFHRKHRSGLRLVQITDAQWTGEGSLDEVKKVISKAASSGQTVVTSLKGSPVSISALSKPPSESKE